MATPWVVRYDLRAPAFGTPAPELYAAALEQCAWADDHRVEQVILSDHHGVDDGYLPSPLVFAGAVAARTQHARLRIAAVLLTLRDPILTAEDVIVLDHVSGGRIEVLCVAGYVPAEFRMFGVDFEDRAAIFEQKVELFTRALTGEPFDADGRSGRVTPPPVQRPRPPVLLGGGTPRAARRAARMADGFMPTGPDPRLYDLYTTECGRLGKAPNLTKPEGALFVHVTEDPDRAWAEIAPHALHEMNSYGTWASTVEGAHPYEPIADADSLRAHGLYAVLTPDECVAYAERLDPAAKLILHPLMAGLSPELAWESLELFAAKVLPRIN